MTFVVCDATSEWVCVCWLTADVIGRCRLPKPMFNVQTIIYLPGFIKFPLPSPRWMIEWIYVYSILAVVFSPFSRYFYYIELKLCVLYAELLQTNFRLVNFFVSTHSLSLPFIPSPSDWFVVHSFRWISIFACRSQCIRSNNETVLHHWKFNNVYLHKNKIYMCVQCSSIWSERTEWTRGETTKKKCDGNIGVVTERKEFLYCCVERT